VISTLIALNEWITTIQGGGPNGVLSRTKVKATLNPGADVVATIAAGLVEHAAGIERDLLSKSVQETLFYCVNFEAPANYSQIEKLLARFLARRGHAAVIQRFLSFHFFNFVWLETGESFRALACTPKSFERDMDEVDRVCQRVVAWIWRLQQMETRPLDKSAAEEVVQKIEGRLRGV
jgi:hypothetical protein